MTHPVDLTPWLNAAVATFDGERPRGALNAWGNSFPAEELPFGSLLKVGGVDFRLPAKAPGEPDSVEPFGQTIVVPGAPRAVGIALLCCGEMGDQWVPVRVLGDRQVQRDQAEFPRPTSPGEKWIPGNRQQVRDRDGEKQAH